MKKSGQIKNWIILGTLFIIEAGIIIGLAKLISNTSEKLVEQKHKLWALENKDKSLYNLQKDYDLVKEDLGLLNQVLPNKKGMIAFLDRLEKEASDTGLAIRVNFNENSLTKESKNIKSINFSLNLSGTYFSIVNFLRKIENMPQFVNVENINIQSPDGLSSENRAVVLMKCYVDPNF